MSKITKKVSDYGTIRFFDENNLPHNENDDPAIIHSNGDKTWFKHGIIHRDNGPAFEWLDRKCWIKDGKLHRLDGPTQEYTDGTKIYQIDGKNLSEEKFYDHPDCKIKKAEKEKPFKIINSSDDKHYTTYNEKGQRHSYNDQPASISSYGKTWCKNGIIHRDNGPAFDWTDQKAWVKDGVYHREDGPAIEYANGNKLWMQKALMHRTDGPAHIEGKFQYYYIDNVKLTEEEFYKHPKCQIKKIIEETLINKTYDIDPNSVEKITSSNWYYYFTDPNGVKHNNNDEPAMVYKNGDKEWWQHGKIHRENGPAMIYETQDNYCQNNHFHRLDEPARILYTDETKTQSKKLEWWIDGDFLTEEQFYAHPLCQVKKENIQKELTGLQKAIYRSTTDQLVSSSKKIIFGLLKNNNVEFKTIEHSEIFEALCRIFLGYTLSQTTIENNHIQHLIKELRISGLSNMGNELISLCIENFMNTINQLNQEVRIADASHNSLDDAQDHNQLTSIYNNSK